MRTNKLLAAVAVLVMILAVAVVIQPAAATDENHPSYWEGQTEHEAECYKHEGNSSHGVVNPDDTVTLNAFNQSWPGDHWELLVIKYATLREVIHHPSAGVPYVTSTNQDVSHWIVCKGITPPDTTTTAPTTSTSTSSTSSTSSTTSSTSSTTTSAPTTTTTEQTSTTSSSTSTTAATTTTVTETTVTTSVPPSTTTTTGETTTTTVAECEEGFVLNDEGDCELPFTGPSGLVPFGIGATGLLLLGSAFLLGSRRYGSGLVGR